MADRRDSTPGVGPTPSDEAPTAWLARALDNLATAYPHLPVHVVSGPGDHERRHAERHPAFWGAFDWHSSVHMHWLVVHLLRTRSGMPRADEACAMLRTRMTADHLAVEQAYLRDHPTFERPYGWAWLVRLHAEAAGWDDPDGVAVAAALTPLRDALVERFAAWLPMLAYPVRHGLHYNTALALLLLDRSGESTGDGALRELVRTQAERLYGEDRDAPVHWEPSGEDFISPSLSEAHLLARVRPQAEYVVWLERFLPGLAAGEVGNLALPPEVRDPTDYRIGHLVGLGLTRAWHWRALGAALPDDHPGRVVALRAAGEHLAASLPLMETSGYGGDHWLATYAALAIDGD